MPWSVLSDSCFLVIAMMQRRITNLLSARVTGSLILKLSRKNGGLVATSMVMLASSQVRDNLWDGDVEVTDEGFCSDVC